MRKKSSLILVLIVVLVSLGYFGYSIVMKTREKQTGKERVQSIPDFKLFTLSGKPFHKKHLKGNLKTIFIYFNSECEFCQHEAQSIKDHLSEFHKVQFVFISAEPKTTIKQF